MYNIYNFIFYSIIGFILEIIFKLIFNSNLHSGILFGPYCPVYGFGITTIYFIFEKINKKTKNKKTKKIFLFFITSFFLLTTLELIGGYLIKIIFNFSFWNYKEYVFNIGKYISLEMSLLWSIGSIFAYYYIKPLTDKLYFKINKKIIIISLIIIIIDLILKVILK